MSTTMSPPPSQSSSPFYYPSTTTPSNPFQISPIPPFSPPPSDTSPPNPRAQVRGDNGLAVIPPYRGGSASSSSTGTIPLSPPAEYPASPPFAAGFPTSPSSPPTFTSTPPRKTPTPTHAAPVVSPSAAARKRATYNVLTGLAAGSSPSPPNLSAEYTLHPSIAAYQTAHPRRALVNFGPYILLQTLGEGEFGKVKLGVHREFGEEVAVKLIRRGSVDNQTRLGKVEREIEVLKTVKHPNIVRLFDVIETEKYIGIILDFANGGELFDHILAHRYLKEKDAAKLFAQLISGVHYLHQKHIVHRDLKLENLLLDKHRNVIITDFGFANRFEHKQDDLMATSCGSPCYAAPELVISEGLYVGSAVDIWSCGVILYAMLSGYLPFDDDPANPEGDNINLLYRYIVNTPLTFPDYISPEARDLLLRMLVPDPVKRCTLQDIMAHIWLRPYAPLFLRSVMELENIAQEQMQHKRATSRRDMQQRMKMQEAARIAQLAKQAAKASGLPPAPGLYANPLQQRHQSAMPMLTTMPTMPSAPFLFTSDAFAPPASLPKATTSTGLPAPASFPAQSAPHNVLVSSDLANTRVRSAGMEPESSGSGTEAEVVQMEGDARGTPRARGGDSHPTTPKASKIHAINVDSTPTQASVAPRARADENDTAAERDRKDSYSPAPSSDSKKRPASANKNRHTIQVEYDGEAAYEKILEIQQARDEAAREGRDADGDVDMDAAISGQAQSDTERGPIREFRSAGVQTGDAATEMASPVGTLSGETAKRSEEEEETEVLATVPDTPMEKALPTPSSSQLGIPIAKPGHSHTTSTERNTPPPTPPTGKVIAISLPTSRASSSGSNQPGSMGPPPLPTNRQTSGSSYEENAARSYGSSTSLSKQSTGESNLPPVTKKERSRKGMSMDKFGLGKLLASANMSTDSFTNFGRPPSRGAESAKLQRAQSVKVKEAEKEAEKLRQKEANAKKTRRMTLNLASDATKNESPERRAKSSKLPAVPHSAHPLSTTERPAKAPRPPSMVIQTDRILPPRPADRSPSNPSLTTFDVAGSTGGTKTPRHPPNASSSAAKKVMDWFRRKSLAKNSFTIPQTPATQADSESASYPGGAPVVVSSPSSLRNEDEPFASSSSDVAQTPIDSNPTVVVTSPPHVQDTPDVPAAPTHSVAPQSTQPVQDENEPPRSAANFAKPSATAAAAGNRAKSHRPVTSGAPMSSMPPPPVPTHSDSRLRTHNGVVDQQALTSKPALEVMSDVYQVLHSMGIEVKRESEFRLRCTRPRRRKAGATTGLGLSSVMSGGSLASFTMGSPAASGGVDRRGLPIPSSPSGLLSASGGIRGILRRGSSYASGANALGSSPVLSSDHSPATSSQGGNSPGEGHVARQMPDPLYGSHTEDSGDEVRFTVELTRIKNLPGLLSLDMKRLSRGNVWSYKFLYQTIIERCETLTH